MNSREKLVQAAADLLWDRGYTATSPSLIQQRAGVGQGSMYHHFTGKADLAAAGMARAAQDLRVDAQDALDGPGTAIERVLRYLDLPRDPMRGCRLGRLAQDKDVLAEEPLREVVAGFFTWLCGSLTTVLAAGQRAGEVRVDVVPADLAALVVAAVQGGYVLARATTSTEAYLSAIRAARTAVAMAATTGASTEAAP